MNREIKFRVYNPQEKLMTNVRLCDYMGFHGIVYDRVGCNNEDNVWMQFTGLTDINGKEIYEGDIIKTTYNNAKVKFKDGMFGIKKYNSRYGQSFTNSLEIFEVIGNIYEHKHLLNEQI